MLTLGEDSTLLDNIHIDRSSIFGVGAQEVPVICLEYLLDLGLVSSDLISYMENIDGIFPMPLFNGVVEKFCVLIPYCELIYFCFLLKS